MKTFTKKVLAAKVAFVMAVTAVPGVMTPAYAGIPVIDGANLTQTVMSAIENVAQTLKQIQQYQTQLQQYQNMLQNTTAPATNIWDQATATMVGFVGLSTLSAITKTTSEVLTLI